MNNFPESHCVKTSKRMAEYESKKATEDSLIKLGKQMATQENKKYQSKERYRQICRHIQELYDFDSDMFVMRAASGDERKRYAVIKSITKYIRSFINLHEYHLMVVSKYKKEVTDLKDEIQIMDETMENYITEIDKLEENEKKRVVILEDIRARYGKLVNKNKKLVKANYRMAQVIVVLIVIIAAMVVVHVAL